MSSAARAGGVGNVVVGLAMLTRPVDVVATVRGRDCAPPPVIVRVLGARQAVQGIAQIARPRRGVLLGGAVIDVVHAVSMVALAVLDPRHRRLASTSAAAAIGSAALGVAGARAGRR